MKLITFTARCQRESIPEQFVDGARCFDLRVRFDNDGNIIIAHGLVEYRHTMTQLKQDLEWLEMVNSEKSPVYVRVLHEVRKAKDWNHTKKMMFRRFCEEIDNRYGIVFFGGNNLYNWEVDYEFVKPAGCIDFTIEDAYASVAKPKILDDWWPWLYARLNNIKNITNGTDKDILMVDFVDIQ